MALIDWPLRPTTTRPSPASTRSSLFGAVMGSPSRGFSCTTKKAPRAHLYVLDCQVREGPALRNHHDLDGKPEIAQGPLELLHAIRLANKAGRFGKQDDLGDTLRADMRGQHHLVGPSI
jgi:hypothetical protein